MMYYYGDFWSWPLMGGFMMIFWILFLGLLIWLIFYLIKQNPLGLQLNGSQIRQKKPQMSPIAIAKERYAKGEIKKKEFKEIIKTLNNMKTITITIKGMHCNSCKMLIEDALEDLGTIKANVDMTTNTVIITFDEKKLTLSQIKDSIIGEGYKLV